MAPGNAGWACDKDSGIAADGSSMGNPNAVQGRQVALIRSAGTIKGSLPAPATGKPLQLRLHAAYRQDNGPVMEVRVDGKAVGKVAPKGPGFESWTSEVFQTDKKEVAIEFVGLHPKHGDKMLFIDQIDIKELGS
jgi:hypothetical protein